LATQEELPNRSICPTQLKSFAVASNFMSGRSKVKILISLKKASHDEDRRQERILMHSAGKSI